MVYVRRKRRGTTDKQRATGQKHRREWPFLDEQNPRGFVRFIAAYLESLKVRGRAEETVRSCDFALRHFALWCQDRDLIAPHQVTKPVLERYQRMLFYIRKEDGSPLTLASQAQRLTFLKRFFLWLVKQNYLLSNPASGLELPRVEKRLPKHVLTANQAETILGQPDLEKPYGIRDRALLETLYSTGMRRKEAARLKLVDIDLERGAVMVRQGKGRKDRMIPIGERALAWIERYVREVRPVYVVEPDDGTLFLSHRGGPLTAENLSTLVGKYIRGSGVAKEGGCHLFRHAMATLMMENGADIRMIQAMLGHAKLETTEIYTHVAIKKLKEIHTATHPSAKLGKPETPQNEPDERLEPDDSENGGE